MREVNVWLKGLGSCNTHLSSNQAQLANSKGSHDTDKLFPGLFSSKSYKCYGNATLLRMNGLLYYSCSGFYSLHLGWPYLHPTMTVNNFCTEVSHKWMSTADNSRGSVSSFHISRTNCYYSCHSDFSLTVATCRCQGLHYTYSSFNVSMSNGCWSHIWDLTRY